ncbi:MAG: efflux transporter outer membrane subunit [Porphyromonas sp.]|nr:efflux transporter outer membrane subunit [Porphyromonas sp.]
MKRNSLLILSALLIGSGLSSCGIYGSYQRPEEIKVERLFRSPDTPSDTLAVTEHNSADLTWQEFFTDPYLVGLIEQGLERNADLRVAQLGLEQSKAALMSAKLGFLPNISAAPFGQYTHNTEQWTYNLPITASWEIDLFGKLRNSHRQQYHQTKMVQAQVQLVQTNIIAAIANSYYTLLMLDQQLVISEETITTWQENLRILRILKETGNITEAAIAQAEAQTFALLDMKVDLLKQQRTVENALSALLQLPPGQIERGTLTDQPFVEKVEVGLPVQLLAYRPDVRMAEERLAMAYYGANRARSDFLPSIKLTATGAWTNALGQVIVDPFTFIGNAVGTLFQPIFNNGRNVAQLRIAKAQQEQATIEFQQSLINAGVEVSNQLYSLKSYRTKIDNRTRQIETLTRAVEITSQLMTLGTATYLEVLTAQQQLLTAKLGYTTDLFGQIQSQINLYKALGGGSTKVESAR